jgi:hypothetical protein
MGLLVETSKLLFPVQIFVGEKQCAQDYVRQLIYDNNYTDNTCDICWISPTGKNGYVLDDLVALKDRIKYKFDKDTFYILNHVDLLFDACANTLLKVLEESKTGCFFFLLTDNIDLVLPTVRSRAMMVMLPEDNSFDYLSVEYRNFFDELLCDNCHNKENSWCVLHELIQKAPPDYTLVSGLMQFCLHKAGVYNKLIVLSALYDLYNRLLRQANARIALRLLYMTIIIKRT